MKKVFTVFATLLFASMLAWGQRAGVREEVMANPLKAYGTDFPYPTEFRPLTKAPKGYKPFYISHYGRHGSRYYWNESLYKNMDSLLTEAHDKGALNEAGLAFYDKIYSILPELTHGVSEMTPLGYQQHVRIAKMMYNSFPEVFKNGGHVDAISSLSDRCIISMAAFCQSLAGCNSKLDIYQRASRETLHGVVPDDKENPYRREFPREEFPVKGNPSSAQTPSVGKMPFVDMFFKDVSLINWEPRRLQSVLNSFYTSLPNIGYEGIMGQPYSLEELYAQWENSSAGAYRGFWSGRLRMIPILEDILDKAEDVVSGKSHDVASLRFGHDSYLGPLTVLLGLDGSSTVPADPDDFKSVYQNYRTGMGANIQLVFYRSNKPGKDVLVKALLCGEEVTLPLPGDLYPYYKWSDFISYYRGLCDQYKQ